jgi:hypothetical protein
MRAHILLPALIPLTVAACKAPCQSLCDEMSALAQDCGQSVSEAELDTCYENNARGTTSRDAQDVCAENIDALRDEWTCDDLTVYFGDGGDGDGGGGGGEDTAGR